MWRSGCGRTKILCQKMVSKTHGTDIKFRFKNHSPNKNKSLKSGSVVQSWWHHHPKRSKCYWWPKIKKNRYCHVLFLSHLQTLWPASHSTPWESIAPLLYPSIHGYSSGVRDKVLNKKENSHHCIREKFKHESINQKQKSMCMVCNFNFTNHLWILETTCSHS